MESAHVSGVAPCERLNRIGTPVILELGQDVCLFESNTHVKTSPKISVVIPVYNCQEFVRTAIHSILAQTYRDFELLLLDDASSDGSLEIMQSFKDPRIRLIRNDVNLGIAKTHNRGIELARGEYLAMLDHDDYSYPDRLAQQLDVLERNRDFALLGTWGELMDETGRRLGNVKRYPVSSEDIWSSLLFMNCILHPSIMARTRILEEYRYSERFSICDDFDLFIRIARNHKVGNLPKVLVRHRRHSRRTSERKAHMKKGENFEIFSAQLRELEISFNDADLEKHLALARPKTLKTQLDHDYLDWAETWLQRLEEANRLRSCYPEQTFFRVLGTMWLKACWHTSRKSGVTAWKRFLCSPLRRGTWLSLNKHLKLRMGTRLGVTSVP